MIEHPMDDHPVVRRSFIERSRGKFYRARRWLSRFLLGDESSGPEVFEPHVGTLEPRIVLNATAELSALTGLSILGDGASDQVQIQLVDNGNSIQLVDSAGDPIAINGHTTGATGAETDPLALTEIAGGNISVDLGGGHDTLQATLPKQLSLNVTDGAGDDVVELEFDSGTAPATGATTAQVVAETIDLRPSGNAIDVSDRALVFQGDVIVGNPGLQTDIELGSGSIDLEGTLTTEGSLWVSGSDALLDWSDAVVGSVGGSHDLEISLGLGASVSIGEVGLGIDEFNVSSARDIVLAGDLDVGSASFAASDAISATEIEIDADRRIEFLTDSGFSGTVTLDAPETLFDGPVSVTDSSAVVVEGSLVDSVTQTRLGKTGGGELVLSGDSNHTTDILVSGGALRVDGTLGTEIDIEVRTGGTLSGSGTIDGRASLFGGTLAPAAEFPLDREGALRIATLEVDADATLEFDVAGTVEGANVDTAIVLNGPVDLAGAKVEFDLLAPLPGGRDFLILQNESGSAVSGRLTAMFDVEGNTLATPRILEEGDLILTSFGLGTDTPAYITYAGGDGNDVAVVTGGNHIQTGSADATLITRVNDNLHIQQGTDFADAQQATPTIRPLAALNGNFVTVRGASPGSELFVDVDGFNDAALPYDVNLSFQVAAVGGQGSARLFDSDASTNDAAATVQAEFVSADILRMNADPDSNPDYDILLSGVNQVRWELPSDVYRFLATNQDDLVMFSESSAPGMTELTLNSAGSAHQFLLESPSETLSLDARGGDDQLIVESLATDFRAVLSLEDGIGNDSIAWNADARLGIDAVARDMNLEAESVTIRANLQLLGGGTLTIGAADQLSIVGEIEVNEGRIAIASGAPISDLSGAMLQSDNDSEAIFLEGDSFTLGDVIAPSGQVILGESLSRSIGDVSQSASTSIESRELIAHSL
ncbi:MAG: hypothetical protein AAFU85_16705, partial [Planctomycetota bacterium]